MSHVVTHSHSLLCTDFHPPTDASALVIPLGEEEIVLSFVRILCRTDTLWRLTNVQVFYICQILGPEFIVSTAHPAQSTGSTAHSVYMHVTAHLCNRHKAVCINTITCKYVLLTD